MSRTSFDLLAIGDVTVDVFLFLHEASVHCHLDSRTCMLCLKYAEKVPVDRVSQVPVAGNAANNAVGSARLGLRTGLVTVLGDDEAGHRIVPALSRERVDMRYVTLDRRRGTNYSVVLSFRSERTILVYHHPRAYRLPRLAPSAWVYLTSMGTGWERIVRPLLRYVRESGTRLAFNPGTHQLRSSPSVLRTLWARTDVLLLNREEASHVLGVKPSTRPAALVRGLLALGPRIVAVTDGPRGSYAGRGSAWWSMPPFPVRAVERTGAGDAFSTGFLAALHENQDIPEALRWGTANAGSVIQQIGPQAGLLSRTGMRRILRSRAAGRARPVVAVRRASEAVAV